MLEFCLNWPQHWDTYKTALTWLSHCRLLAAKHVWAVDYPKTGVAPELRDEHRVKVRDTELPLMAMLV